jgi:hypothetical protein
LVKVPPLEQILCRGRFRHPGRYGCTPVFSSLHQNPRGDATPNSIISSANLDPSISTILLPIFET